MKKLLALVLALVMSMSLVTISNAAFKDADKIDYKEAVDVMNAVGVFIGDEKGNFNAKDNLTREQAAKIIAYLELGDKAADALVGGATFTDVASTRWSAGFVGYCAQAGVVAGVGDGKFDPAGQLTALQFGKMLLVELGYDAKAAGMVGADWAINTSKLMAKANLMDGIEGSVNQVITREKAAKMCLNALEAPTVEYDTKGSNITVNGAEINFGASEPTYVTNTIAKEQTISNEKLSNSNAYLIELGEKLYKNLKKIGTTDDFGRPATKWTWKSETVGTYADAADLSYTKAVKASDIYKDLNLSDDIAAKDVTVWVNGEKKTAAATDIKKANDTKIGDVAGVKSNGNGVLTEVFYDDVADTMVITQIVTYIGEVNKTVKATDNRDAYIVIETKTGGNGMTKPTAKGTYEYETDEKFEDNTFVLYTYSVKAEGVKSVKAAEKVEGYVSKTINKASDLDQNNGMTISGTEYKMSLATAGDKLGNVSVKNDYTVYLDEYGYIIYIEEIEEIGNYALVLATASKGSFIGNKAQLLLTDGTVKFVDTEENYHSGTKAIDDNTIVTFRENSDKTYTLRAVDDAKVGSLEQSAAIVLKNDKAKVDLGGTPLYANSATQFVVADKLTNDAAVVAAFAANNHTDIDDWTAYTGIKTVPSISGGSVSAYWYCKNSNNSMITVMFVVPNNTANVEDDNKAMIYFAGESKSDLIHDEDGDYFEYNVVVNGKIDTVKVDYDCPNAASLNGIYKSYNTNSKGYVTKVADGYVDYNGNNGDDTKAVLNGGVGIDKTSKEYTVTLDTKTNKWTITVDDKANIYYVDKDGKISEYSYGAIYVDEDDKVYALIDDSMVQYLFVEEVVAPYTPTTPVTPSGEYTLPSFTNLSVGGTATGVDAAAKLDGRYDATNGKLYVQVNTLGASKIANADIVLNIVDTTGNGKTVTIKDVDVNKAGQSKVMVVDFTASPNAFAVLPATSITVTAAASKVNSYYVTVSGSAAADVTLASETVKNAKDTEITFTVKAPAGAAKWTYGITSGGSVNITPVTTGLTLGTPVTGLTSSSETLKVKLTGAGTAPKIDVNTVVEEYTLTSTVAAGAAQAGVQNVYPYGSTAIVPTGVTPSVVVYLDKPAVSGDKVKVTYKLNGTEDTAEQAVTAGAVNQAINLNATGTVTKATTLEITKVELMKQVTFSNITATGNLTANGVVTVKDSKGNAVTSNSTFVAVGEKLTVTVKPVTVTGAGVKLTCDGVAKDFATSATEATFTYVVKDAASNTVTPLLLT